ncbi:MAG: hypothetical protein G4V63_09445 [Candidatus Afipia apatlaquensis]|uniref:Uncharacterized protein n=1 Tax=Candidatus Afipia apatlaquensis TaxID=2712852 RepID=A0A7C9VDB9_9BRAD|nr:hypothetical protein [Candidatus Afipia apatlaquensis]
MDTQSIPGLAAREIDCVNKREVTPLTFTAVDGLAFAAQKGKLGRSSSHSFMAGDIGPLLELRHLSADGLLTPFENILSESPSYTTDLFLALKQSQQLWICPSTRRAGFFRTTDSEADASNAYHFGMAAQKAAIDAGFSKHVGSQLVAAVLEMVDNIYLHSTLSETGLAAFHARPGYFEFAVVDRGVGILRSLQENSEYAQLNDHGDALQTALTDGCSRFGSDSKHGHGFRSLFIGLSNLNGALRFRTGDHALTIDGRDPISIPWTKLAKPNISGFLAFVSCRTHARSKG